MIKSLGWLRLGFLALFLVLTAATWAYQLLWQAPKRECIAAGRWWSDQDRECGIPVSVSRFTGRPTPPELAGRGSAAATPSAAVRPVSSP